MTEQDQANTKAPKADALNPGPTASASSPGHPPDSPTALADSSGRDLAQAPAAEPLVELPPESGGYDGPEPTRYGDWEHKGRCTDF